MMERLHEEEGGANLRVEILQTPEAEDFIETHAQILDTSFSQVKMSQRMRESLQESDRIFSGFKAFCEMGEAFPSLVDEKGNKKPFNQFYNDIKKIDQTYNERYLRAEYNFAEAAGQMAGKWEDMAEDGDDYYLQYRTVNDGQVRPEHAALHGVTLPQSDTFWDAYYPPNGWNCRCTVIQVLKREGEPTPHDEAMRLGNQALAKDKKGMFRFNPGKQEKVFPDYNPYTISKCKICTKKLTLAKSVPDSDLCAACPLIRGNATIDIALKSLHELKGKEYLTKLREITTLRIFKRLEDNRDIHVCPGVETHADYKNLLNSATKATNLGYTVYLLPNPKTTQSGDMILVRKGYIGLYDLKTISGKTSVGNRLEESIGQSNKVLLNITTDLHPRTVATAIKHYFEDSRDSQEVLIFKGKRTILIKRKSIDKDFEQKFFKLWWQKK